MLRFSPKLKKCLLLLLDPSVNLLFFEDSEDQYLQFHIPFQKTKKQGVVVLHLYFFAHVQI